MAAQLLPITSSPNQTMQALLAINGQALVLDLRVYYNSGAQFWAMDIADQTGNPLISSVPLLTGVWPSSNILAPWDYMQIGACYIVNVSGSVTDIPNANNLGSGFIIVWDDNPSYIGGDNPS